ncbi:MAG: LuxR family transcriptional regulator [Proteobacteria bacterium]|nr:LuxR family transcriptional regulator [Pseudomonadota bacterium]
MNTTRDQISELEKQNQIKVEIETEKAKIESSLRERIKELNCLYGVAELIERNEHSIGKILQGVADLLPVSWQYPEVTCSRIIFKNQEYQTSLFSISQWKQSADILEAGEKVGIMEVYYLKEMPVIDEGPFLREERLLINAVAERVGRAIEQINVEMQLEVERESLRNMNITLREVLSRIQDEQKEAGRTIQANVDKIIMPILHTLESEVSSDLKKYILLVKRNLEEIVSPFTNKLSNDFMSLTPVEIQISNMIKNGMSTKEIARLRYISDATVNRHRENIRKKLGIKNKKINLSTFLRTYMTE